MRQRPTDVIAEWTAPDLEPESGPEPEDQDPCGLQPVSATELGRGLKERNRAVRKHGKDGGARNKSRQALGRALAKAFGR